MDCGTGLCRADTSARRKAEDAGATPEAAAQIKREADLDGFRAKPERENDGKNGEHHKKLRPGEDGGVSAPLHLQRPGYSEGTAQAAHGTAITEGCFHSKGPETGPGRC